MTVAVSPLIRPARLADAEALTAVQQASWAAAYAAHMPAGYLATRIRGEALHSAWVERLTRVVDADPAGTERVLVAEHVGRVVGYADGGQAAAGEQPVGDRRAEWELRRLYVHPDGWGHGVGPALYDALIAGLSPQTAVLWVFAPNERAQRFYRRRGWRPDGIARVFLVGDTPPLLDLRYTLPRLGD